MLYRAMLLAALAAPSAALLGGAAVKPAARPIVAAKFFGFLPGPPQFWTLSAAATQIAGAGPLGLGVLSRPVAASMSATMIVAVIFHLLNTGGEAYPLGIPTAHSYNFELAAMYVLVLAFFTVNGAGKYSVDQQLLGGEIELYKKGLNAVGFDPD